MYEYLSVQKFQTLGFYYKPILIKKKIEFYIILKEIKTMCHNIQLFKYFVIFLTILHFILMYFEKSNYILKQF